MNTEYINISYAFDAIRLVQTRQKDAKIYQLQAEKHRAFLFELFISYLAIE